MSRTDFLAAGDPARPATRFHDDGAAQAGLPVMAAVPHEALALLPALHRQAGHDLKLLGLLAASPRLCLVLMGQAAIVLAWTGTTALSARFAWAAALALGIAGIARNHIRSFARVPRQVPPAQAARELHGLFLYTAMTWGLGAFLILPPAWGPWTVFLFMTAPSLAALFVLHCEKSFLVFALPAGLLTVADLWWRG